MAQSNLKVGNIVELKSGSPEMTVREVITKEFYFGGGSGELEFNKIKVDWFVETERKSAEFIEQQLNKLEDNQDH
ncbi:DUF2158 domain-containing protein [Chryseobacterium indoltheticum]|uniref:DUF2158 domain-containing protein n=1 Tax=Chryseobacterium indoltheticum TaxID=254 RepID=UPI0019114FBA|nr:DUF2158 domain-containing protein [Chryseobacterium indoltheticum]QQQ28673.1 DUF2158 domain-containing protein [Chryseobacterium indoltheticum]